jgi:DNA-binding IclR family transcriptional regulator
VLGTELAAGLQIHPRTARRLLHKLVQEQYATSTPRRYRHGPVYALSPRLIGLAAQAIHCLPLTIAADRPLADLHEQLGRPVFIATPSYRHVVVVHNRGAPPRRWELLPAHASAAGKVLLAHRPSWRAAVSARPLAPVSPATLTTPDQLEHEAQCILERGFATEAAEHVPDRHAVAVAIPSGSDQIPIAALTATIAPHEEASGECAAAIGHHLTLSAELICRKEQTRLRELPRLPWVGSPGDVADHGGHGVRTAHQQQVSS